MLQKLLVGFGGYVAFGCLSQSFPLRCKVHHILRLRGSYSLFVVASPARAVRDEKGT